MPGLATVSVSSRCCNTGEPWAAETTNICSSRSGGWVPVGWVLMRAPWLPVSSCVSGSGDKGPAFPLPGVRVDGPPRGATAGGGRGGWGLYVLPFWNPWEAGPLRAHQASVPPPAPERAQASPGSILPTVASTFSWPQSPWGCPELIATSGPARRVAWGSWAKF